MDTKSAVKYFGSKTKLAAALGIKRSAVSNWGNTIPVRRAYEIERLTNGALKAPLPEHSNGSNQQVTSAS